MRGALVLFAGAAAALAVAGSAPTATIALGNGYSLQVGTDAGLGTTTATSVNLNLATSSDSPAVVAVSVRVPKGYTLQLDRPTGTPIGSAVLFWGDFSAATPPTIAIGSIKIADPTAAAADPASQACDPNPHLAVLALALQTPANTTIPATIFVDGPGDDSNAAYLLELCPPAQPGQPLGAVSLSIDGSILLAPTTPAVYTWSAFVTPASPGASIADPTKTFELRADLPVPQDLTLEATYNEKTRKAMLSGHYTILGAPQPGVDVSLSASSRHAHADFGPARTDGKGRYTYSWPIDETTNFQASVDGKPPGRVTAPRLHPAGA
jgi:hypothetical protein